MSTTRAACGACGAALAPGAASCEECGAPTSAGAPGEGTPPCPECGGATARAGSESRPEEPRPFSLLAWCLMLLVPFLNVLSLFIAPFTLGLKLFMGAVGVAYVGTVAWAAAGTFADPFAARDAAMMAGATAFALYFVALVHSWRVDRRDVAARRVPAWRRGVERWEHLVRCEACSTFFFDDQEGAPAPVERAPELLGAAEWDRRGDARTPLWLWAILAVLAVGGGDFVGSFAREAGAEPAAAAPADPSVWEDIERDPVRADTTGGAGRADLGEPLLGPPTSAPDTTPERGGPR